MLEGNVYLRTGSLPSAWGEVPLWSAVTSLVCELLRGEAAVCWAGGESEQGHGCSPGLVQEEGGGSHPLASPVVQGHLASDGGQCCVA